MQDYHLHSTFSCDGHMTMDELVSRAEALGLTEIAVTEHIDIEPSYSAFIVDVDAYSAAIDEVRARHPGIVIRKGLELGDTRGSRARIQSVAERAGLDFALLSRHAVNGVDPYDADRYFIPGRTREDAYGAYVAAVLESAMEYGPFSALAHVGYCAKRAPYEGAQRPLEWADAPDALDAILKRVIDMGAALEVNTSGYPIIGQPIPAVSILRRYAALGGELVTLGSDAHRTDNIAQYFGDALALLRELGIRYGVSYHHLEAQPYLLR